MTAYHIKEMTIMREAGHTFLARMGKTKLRPGGIDATNWLLEKAKIQPSSKVLEVACNVGTTMILVAERYGCEVVGIDLDEAALEKARENIKKKKLEDKLSVVSGSAFALPFKDASFDVVINEAMLDFFHDHAAQLGYVANFSARV